MAWGSPAKVLTGNFVVDVVPLLEERCVCTIFREGRRGKTGAYMRSRVEAERR